MNVFVLKTKRGMPTDKLVEVFQDIGPVQVINNFDSVDDMSGSLYLSHIPASDNKSIDTVSIKVQNVLAWNKISQMDIPAALVVLDTVRVVGSFAKNARVPDGADIGILSQSNMRINGIHLNGTDWVFLDSDDPNANNICNAYIITKSAAGKLYERRNDLLGCNIPFAVYINSISNFLATDRITTYMSLNCTSSKPIYI